MYARTLGVVVIILLVAGATGGALYYNYIQHTQGIKSTPPPTTATSTPPTLLLGAIPVTAVSSTTITLETTYQGQTLTYTFSKAAQLYSRVAVGEIGRTLNDIAVGDKLIIYPSKDNPSHPGYLNLPTKWSIAETPEDEARAVVGVVTSLSANAVTITPASGPAVTITLTSSTPIITQVAGGQKGLPLAEGRHVRAIRVTTAEGKTTAQEILIANSDVAK